MDSGQNVNGVSYEDNLSQTMVALLQLVQNGKASPGEVEELEEICFKLLARHKAKPKKDR